MSETNLVHIADVTQEYGRRIFDLAHSGATRQRFIEDSLKLIAQAVECRAVRLVIRDREHRFFGQSQSFARSPSEVVVTATDISAGAGMRWTSGTNEALENLCRRLIAGHVDTGLPWFTESGCLSIEDVRVFAGEALACEDLENADGLYLSADCRSTLIIPIDGTRRRLGLLLLESPVPGYFSPRPMNLCERLTHTFGIAIDLRHLQVALRERVKELTCLYDVARLMARSESPLNEIMQQAVEQLPSGWFYPDSAAARITLDDRIHETRGAQNMVQRMNADIVIDGLKRGLVEVGYTEQKPPADDGPFLTEERDLLDTIARELAFTIQQRSYAEERQKLQVQLRHADRLATIGQLAAGVAHELNEPLVSIMGFAQLAAKQPGVPADVVRDLNKIVAASFHARGIIRELLVFAREARPVKITFNLNELIRDGLFFLESRFVKAGISLTCELDPNLPQITADRSQMLQVLTNLVVNSVQAMPNGGRLNITTSAGNGHVQLVITDNGCGMDEVVAKDIFHPFFTTKDLDQGTGLGLSVVHGIVTAHDGRIDVTSRPGEGSSFRIHLPITAPSNTTEILPIAE
jgi:two-component system NtrC family sensor kinase